MLPQNTDQVKHARQELETKLTGHCRIIVDIKIRLNSLLPIAHLPDEILLEIFKHYRDICSRDPNRIDSWWVNLTRVCHHWREVAMDSPSIWADIDFTFNSPRVTEMLARSKEVKVKVRADLPRLSALSEWAASIETLAKALHRAQSIDLTLYPNVYGIMAKHTPSALNHLQAISLQCPSLSEMVSLPTVLDGSDLPSLKDPGLSY